MAGLYNSNPPTPFGYTRDKDFQIVRGRKGKSYYRFSIEGLDDLANELKAYYNDMAGEEGKAALELAIQPTAERVRRNVPVDTSSLKDSVRTTRARQDRRGVLVKVLVGYPYRRTKGGKRKGPTPRPAYALQVEYGTAERHFRDEQPFVRPAFDGHEQAMANDVAKALKLRVIRARFYSRLGRSPALGPKGKGTVWQ